MSSSGIPARGDRGGPQRRGRGGPQRGGGRGGLPGQIVQRSEPDLTNATLAEFKRHYHLNSNNPIDMLMEALNEDRISLSNRNGEVNQRATANFDIFSQQAIQSMNTNITTFEELQTYCDDLIRLDPERTDAKAQKATIIKTNGPDSDSDDMDVT